MKHTRNRCRLRSLGIRQRAVGGTPGGDVEALSTAQTAVNKATKKTLPNTWEQSLSQFKRDNPDMQTKHPKVIIKFEDGSQQTYKDKSLGFISKSIPFLREKKPQSIINVPPLSEKSEGDYKIITYNLENYENAVVGDIDDEMVNQFLTHKVGYDNLTNKNVFLVKEKDSNCSVNIMHIERKTSSKIQSSNKYCLLSVMDNFMDLDEDLRKAFLNYAERLAEKKEYTHMLFNALTHQGYSFLMHYGFKKVCAEPAFSFEQIKYYFGSEGTPDEEKMCSFYDRIKKDGESQADVEQMRLKDITTAIYPKLSQFVIDNSRQIITDLTPYDVLEEMTTLDDDEFYEKSDCITFILIIPPYKNALTGLLCKPLKNTVGNTVTQPTK